MRRPPRPNLRSFAAEATVYAGLVTAYVLLVLRLLGPWFRGLFLHQRLVYAGAALAAVLVQGVLLEQVTHALLRLFRIRRDS